MINPSCSRRTLCSTKITCHLLLFYKNVLYKQLSFLITVLNLSRQARVKCALALNTEQHATCCLAKHSGTCTLLLDRQFWSQTTLPGATSARRACNYCRSSKSLQASMNLEAFLLLASLFCPRFQSCEERFGLTIRAEAA